MTNKESEFVAPERLINFSGIEVDCEGRFI